ncbi:hypothetical protein [Pseudonocardia broussonetiae]|uniref:Uncharacterized protein n=1 Tax=Pseudonocardia broussonetiae TaxID=2736640 RepID=A0A6M6JHJ5_9PSEU|nr:hypothetical protein [Pseudonocardia broussonetiae]QJY46645.1 hypothetical protein HOP40_13145 [Pseudonocardia broussonetiae]
MGRVLTTTATTQAATVMPALLEYGVLGIVVLLALAAIRVLFSRETAAHDRERERADNNADHIRELNQVMRDQVIPAVTSATATVANAAAVLRDVVELISRDKER